MIFSAFSEKTPSLLLEIVKKGVVFTLDSEEKKVLRNKEKNEHGLTEDQQKVVEMLVFDGKTRLKIAEELGLHRNTITNWGKLPVFIAERRRCEQELARQTKEQMNTFVVAHGMQIMEKLFELSQSTDKRVSAQCSQYLVDRILGKPNAKVEIDADVDGSSVIPSADDILQQLRKRKLEVYNPNKTAKTG